MSTRVVVTGAGVVDGHTSGLTSRLLDETEARRLSRICQFTVAAARLALGEAGLRASRLALPVLGTRARRNRGGA